MPPSSSPLPNLPFPLEIYLLVKDHISEDDLRTHVCYHESDPRIAALYDSDPQGDTFWEILCWKCGIGAMRKETHSAVYLAHPWFWRDLAVDLIHCDGFCTYPGCGEALLKYNRARMRQAQRVIRPLSVLRCDEDQTCHHSRLGMHRALTEISFVDENLWKRNKRAGMLQQAFLRQPNLENAWTEDAEQDMPDFAITLEAHPLITRSYATSIPVDYLELGLIQGYRMPKNLVENGQGIVVRDVVRVFFENLNCYLTVAEAAEFVEDHEDHFPTSWTPSDVFRKLRMLRGMLSICPVTEFYDEGIMERGHYFSIGLA
ncbi:hypothetical protein C8Q80DRAFT_1273775 [Daedaleopsis nitida]|nr:hypothetical protein C8Q80DRAFT_1273775 [Daedaleopsis nitida]